MNGNDWLEYLKIIRKWWWIVFGVIVVTVLTMLVVFLTSEPQYQAAVRFWVTTPPAGDVSLYQTFRSGSAREETAWARANFIEVLTSGTVSWMTVEQLGVSMSGSDLLDNIEVEETEGSEFVTLRVTANDPRTAADLANRLIEVAILTYGELRGRPATTSLDFLSIQLEETQAKLEQAEQELAIFQTEHDVSDLDTELALMQGLIGSLQQLRDQSHANGDVFSSRRYDEIITERKGELHQLMQLRAEYLELWTPVSRYQALLNLLLEKQIEAQLKVNEATNATFIQIIEPAAVPRKGSLITDPKLVTAGIVAAAIAGVFLAFVLEALEQPKRVAHVGHRAGRPSSIKGK